jgi:hypothetical protein
MAGKYNPNGDILAQGVNVFIRADVDDENGSNPQIIGFVETYSIRANITLQRAECVGEILPVSLDPTSVQVTVSLSGFIPAKNLIDQGIDSVRGGGKLVLKFFNPDYQKLVDTKVITKIPYLDILDSKHKSIIGSTTWLSPTSYQDGGQGKGYVKSDVTLEGIGYNNGPDYKSVI